MSRARCRWPVVVGAAATVSILTAATATAASASGPSTVTPPYGQLWAYIGTKQRTGTPVERAGLTNGRNFVADLVDETVSNDAQFRTAFGKGVPARFDLSEIDWDQSGKDQNAEALANRLSLNRIEDGAFDNNVAEYVERGQLLRMHVDNWNVIYGS